MPQKLFNNNNQSKERIKILESEYSNNFLSYKTLYVRESTVVENGITYYHLRRRTAEDERKNNQRLRLGFLYFIVGLAVIALFYFGLKFSFEVWKWIGGSILFLIVLISVSYFAAKSWVSSSVSQKLNREREVFNAHSAELKVKKRENSALMAELNKANKSRDTVFQSKKELEGQIQVIQVETEKKDKLITKLNKIKPKYEKLKIDLENKFEDKVSQLQTEHKNKEHLMKEENKKKIKALTQKIIKLASEEIEELREDLTNKVEKDILDKTFSTESESFNESKELSREEYYRNKRSEEDDLKREQDKLETERKLVEMTKSILGLKSEMGEKMLEQDKKHVRTELAMGKMETDLRKDLTKLESMIVQGLTKLETKVDLSIAKVEQSISELKSWTESNLIQLKYFVKEEVLRLSENQMKIVNKVDQLETQYKGDVREMKLGMQELSHQIDKVAFDAHERYLALSYVVKEESLRLDGKIEGEVLRLERADMATNNLLEGIQHNLEKGLLMTKMEQRELEYRQDAKYQGLKSDTEKGFLNSKMEQRESEYRQDAKYRDLKGATEKTILEARFDNERNMYVFKGAVDKRLDDLAYKHDIKIKDLTHLAELKGVKLESLINQKHTDITKQIVEMKAKNGSELVKMGAKYDIQLNDMKTLNAKRHYEHEQNMMKVISKVESLHNDISGMNVRMEGMKVEIERSGLASEKVRQDAKNLLYQIEIRMDSINAALKMAQESSRLQQKQIDTELRDGLLRMKEITIDQESKLKEIAFADQGMKLIYDDFNNKAVEKELQLNRLHGNMELMDKSIRNERKAIQVENRLHKGEIVMNNRVMKLENDKYHLKKEADDSKKEANMYRKAANYYEKKYWDS